ncbi:MAG TPA: hypothetical protein VFB38_07725 [Chthonomonadaceae bacterium]|nr:hypothetical protein [Chthonomonadaceae bacterium]
MTSEFNASSEVVATLTMIEPGILLVQIGSYGMTHPPAAHPFEYTRAILKSLRWEDAEIERYISAAQEVGATDDRTLVLKVLQPLSQALREATRNTLNEIAARK